MTERQLQFRVGLFVITAIVGAFGLALRFGELQSFWERSYALAIHFEEAPGVGAGTPVRKNGISIGTVRQVTFDEERGGVTILIDVRERFSLRKDSVAQLSRSLLGDATIEFSPGKSKELLRPGSRIKGEAVVDPMQIVARLEGKVTQTLDSFAATSAEWQRVGSTINNLVDTKRGSLDLVMEQAAESLHQFTLTMTNANKILGDPQNQKNLRVTLAALPEMVEDTRGAIQAARMAMSKIDENMSNLSDITGPLAKRSASIMTKLDKSVGSLEMLLSELTTFSRMLSSKEGSLNQFVTDPQLYRNMNESAAALQIVLKNLDPVVRDMRIFTDKVARHPELIGVGGAFRGSSGLK